MVVPILCQDTVRVTFRVVELPGFHRPQKGGKADTAKKQGNGNEDAKDFHGHFNLRAFSETVMDDSDMASAAASGVASPTSASGTATTL